MGLWVNLFRLTLSSIHPGMMPQMLSISGKTNQLHSTSVSWEIDLEYNSSVQC